MLSGLPSRIVNLIPDAEDSPRVAQARSLATAAKISAAKIVMVTAVFWRVAVSLENYPST
jgi:hypothetical protein